MKHVRAQHIVFRGFQELFIDEAVDKAKLCASKAEYVQCLYFSLDAVEQLSAVLSNNRELPWTVENLCVLLEPSHGRRLIDGRVLACIFRSCAPILKSITFDGPVRTIICLRNVDHAMEYIEELHKVRPSSLLVLC